MSAYQTVVVGTDGSDSSLRAVERAAKLAGSDAKLIIASAYLPQQEDARAVDALKGESYKVTGTGPIYDILHTAKERAHIAGAKNVEERAIEGAPVDALVQPGRVGEGGPAGGRQRRLEHDRGTAAGIGAGQRLA